MITKTLIYFSIFITTSAYFISEEECLNYTVYPVQYEMSIMPHLARERSYYNCDLTITVIANSPNLRMIELDAKDLEIRRESIEVLDSDNRNIVNSERPYGYDRRSGKLQIYLSRDLEPFNVRQRQYMLKLSFTKFLTSEQNGVFLVKYKDKGIEKQMITTRLAPDKAKYFFPCFENSQFEAVFKYKVLQPPPQADSYHDSCIFSSEELRRTSQKDGFTMVEFKPSPQIPVHQAEFHYSSFPNTKVKSHKTNDTLVLWAPESNFVSYKYILNIGQQIMEQITEYSGVDRRIANSPINLVSVPSDIGHYEVDSWNLLTIGDHKLSYSTQFTSINQMQQSAYQLAQQLCRIWLGNPGEIERTRWKEQWFREGVATYLGYYWLSHINQGFWPMEVYGQQIRNKAMSLDWRRDTPNLASFEQMLAMDIPPRYRNLVEWKTAALLWMVENWLGSVRFHNALTKYINTRRGKFISVSDFTTFLQSETVECEFFKGYTAADVLNSWFKQPGYPLVKVTVYRDDGDLHRVHLEQKQFSFSNASRNHHKYLIPISYTTQHAEACYNCFQPQFTIDDTAYSFKENLGNGWIILNRNASGYFRANYDTNTWKMIIATLKSTDRHKIDTYNRAQIINDIFALYMAGEVNYDLAREVASFLEQETDFVVWDSAIDGLEMLKIEGAAVEMTKYLYDDWKKFMRTLLPKVYRRVSSNFRRDHQNRLFKSRMVLFACSIEYGPCTKDLDATLNQIRKDSSYDPDLRQIGYQLLQNHERDNHNVKNRFEKEDLDSARHNSREEARFMYKLLPGSPRPLPLLQSTTTTTPLPILRAGVMETQQYSSSSRMRSISIMNSCCILLIFLLKRNLIRVI